MSLAKGAGGGRSPALTVRARRQTGLIDAIASWCECVQGRLPLLTALKVLAESLNARAVVLSRHGRAPGGSVWAVIHNAPAPTRSGCEVTHSYAQCVLSRYLDRPRPASVCFASLTEGQDDPALDVFQQRSSIAETVVVTLALDEKWADYLEMHFAQAQQGGAQGLFNTLADTLSRTWVRRSPGLFSDAILQSQAQAHRGFHGPILSTANPARLSRAEFRVCVLLSRGLNTQAVCSELALSPSTLKAHLRRIFAKTETSSMAELIYLLLASWTGELGLAATALRRA